MSAELNIIDLDNKVTIISNNRYACFNYQLIFSFYKNIIIF